MLPIFPILHCSHHNTQKKSVIPNADNGNDLIRLLQSGNVLEIKEKLKIKYFKIIQIIIIKTTIRITFY
jgi:hypothetical protein